MMPRSCRVPSHPSSLDNVGDKAVLASITEILQRNKAPYCIARFADSQARPPPQRPAVPPVPPAIVLPPTARCSPPSKDAAAWREPRADTRARICATLPFGRTPAPAPAAPADAPAAAGLAAWSVERVCAWLAELELDDYVEAFRHQRVTGRMLARMTDAHLQAHLGVTTKPVRRMMLASLAALMGGAATARLCAAHQQEIAYVCIADQTAMCTQCVASAPAARPPTPLLAAQAELDAALAAMAQQLAAHVAEGVETVIDIAEHQLHLAQTAEDACAAAAAFFHKVTAQIEAEHARVQAELCAAKDRVAALLAADRARCEEAVRACQEAARNVAAAAQQADVADAASWSAATAARRAGDAALQQPWAHAHGQAGAAWCAVRAVPTAADDAIAGAMALLARAIRIDTVPAGPPR